jgi:alkylation response protein AidB-like acyl-CoA dehydrogenase
MDQVRALEPHDGVDPQRWQALTETGVFAVRRPEDQGGLGFGLTAAAVVFEELGRWLVPGPLVATEVSIAHLPAVGDGSEVIGLVDRRNRPLVVRHLPKLHRLVVIDGDGIWAVDPTGLSAEAVSRPLDPLTSLYVVRSLPQGEPVGNCEQSGLIVRDGAVLTSALLAGSAQAVVELAVAYAQQRQQFGRPIGGFQAIKHILADMQVRASLAQAAVYSAAAHVDDPSVGNPAKAVAAAKVVAQEAALRNARDAIQVHGGMGFTWEIDAHLHLKRAWALDSTFGSASEHADALALTLADAATPARDLSL